MLPVVIIGFAKLQKPTQTHQVRYAGTKYVCVRNMTCVQYASSEAFCGGLLRWPSVDGKATSLGLKVYDGVGLRQSICFYSKIRVWLAQKCPPIIADHPASSEQTISNAQK